MHRDYLRFLWVDDPFGESPKVKPMRFARVIFGVTSSPFILDATLRHHMNSYAATDPELVEGVLKSLYVDDYASGSSSVPSAVDLCKKVKSRLAEGGFNMRKWTSNSKEIVPKLEEVKNCSGEKKFPVQETAIAEEDQG